MKITMKNWHALKEGMYVRAYDYLYHITSDYNAHNNWYDAEIIDIVDDEETVVDTVVITPSDILGGEYYD